MRRLSLSLPEAQERGHHGRPGFRVAGKILATLPDADHVNVMLEPEDVALAAQDPSGACEELYWGRRLTAVRVDLRRVDEGLLQELLVGAWRRRAPRRLLKHVEG